MCRTRNAVRSQGLRGFESHPRRFNLLTMFKFLRRNKKQPENLNEVLKELTKLAEKNAELEKEIVKLKTETQFFFKKVGFIRYNPFDNLGGDQSFSLALLDSNDNGFVITSLFSREGNRVYAKTIKSGQSGYSLSGEEKQALEKAKSF